MKKLIYITALIAITLASCVPARQYDELKASSEKCEEERAEFKKKFDAVNAEFKEYQEQYDRMKKDHGILVQDTTNLGSRYRTLQMQHEMMDRNCQRIQEQLEYLQKQLEMQSSSLSAELEQKKLELQKKDDELRKLAADLKKLEEELNARADLIKEKEERIQELESKLEQQREMLETLESKIQEALFSFKDKGLTVEERNGKIYVSMEAKLLFASGSIKVDPEGRSAIVKLAEALEGQEDLEIVVEGHTDTDALRSNSHPKDNWELSVLRATSVTKIMLENSGIDPTRISASGRSEYVPVDPDDKAKNRRIEIIISPNLTPLLEMLNEE